MHEVTGSTCIQEIYRGQCWEGNALACESILSFFNQLCGYDVIKILKECYNADYVDFVQQIESSVQRIVLNSTEKVTITIPVYSLHKETKKTLKELVIQLGIEEDVSIRADKIRFNLSFFKTFFENSFKYVSGILDKMNSAISKEFQTEITTLFLVGDQECAPIIAEFIQQYLEPSIKIVLSSSESSIRGAMLCGCQ